MYKFNKNKIVDYDFNDNKITLPKKLRLFHKVCNIKKNDNKCDISPQNLNIFIVMMIKFLFYLSII